VNQPHAKPLPGPVNQYGMDAFHAPASNPENLIVIECPYCESPYSMYRADVSFFPCVDCGATFAPPHQFAWMLLPEGKHNAPCPN